MCYILILLLWLSSCYPEHRSPAKGDWENDQPGNQHRVELTELPAPYATPSHDVGRFIAPRPEGTLPQVPKGFKVELFAHEKIGEPRKIRIAPNGDLFVADPVNYTVWIVRDTNQDGKADLIEPFAANFDGPPFGIAFYPSNEDPQYIYLATTYSVFRYPYKNGDLKVDESKREKIVDLPSGSTLRGGGHWTRDIVFSPDGKKMFVSIGSLTDHEDIPEEEVRARIMEYTPEGKEGKVYAWGLRNPVSLAFHPESKALWATVNERDELGDNLVPDYVTEIKEGGFYGFPWYYLGGFKDPRVKETHPELKDKSIVPDVLLQAHSAALGIAFTDGDKLPEPYRGGAFVTLHGSWNRARRTGYKLIYIPMQKGKASNYYIDFMTGFVIDNDHVWGRPANVTLSKDGTLYVTDSAYKAIWKITYTDKPSK